MWQEDGEINYKYIATKISAWATTRYGWFIKGDLHEDDVIDSFAQELRHLPVGCMNHIEHAQHKWIDEGHQKPPTMPDFLQVLRGFYNQQLNNAPKAQIEDRSQEVFSMNASSWDGCVTDEDKEDFVKNRFHSDQVSSATKYWMRDWMRKSGWDDDRIEQTLGYAWG